MFGLCYELKKKRLATQIKHTSWNILEGCACETCVFFLNGFFCDLLLGIFQHRIIIISHVIMFHPYFTWRFSQNDVFSFKLFSGSLVGLWYLSLKRYVHQSANISSRIVLACFQTIYLKLSHTVVLYSLASHSYTLFNTRQRKKIGHDLS